MKVPLTRRQTAPRNLAARALREGQFRPRVEPDPKGYKRRQRHKRPIEAETDDEGKDGA